ncbi:ABC transporter substrate-binding protein [Microbacterium oryzae]|uniref:ABC transporter substrate-binding protein n=1 Tax=Microbacterium oryzae TaxID=743009 RepID=UPI0025B0F64F|nr:ABC transporter substrate-binding protein [Microbacterium oryzae]MDN3311293.1 ABC transporter substrate-binding protein [Microbacterium oryzae]
MRLHPPAPSRLATSALLLTGALALTSCAAASSAEETADSEIVTFALDWAPNTNHIGLYVADELGYFADAGVEVDILPYGSAAASQLVAAGEADFGIGGQATVQLGRTAGLDVTSVFAVTQKDVGRLVTDEDISGPAELDGGVFGGFGSPLYTATAQTVLRGDGGTGEFEEVVLDTGAYEALHQGRIDFTLSVATWENIQAELDGHPYTSFRYQDYGVPEQQSIGVISSDAYLDAHPGTAEAFTRALQRGYAYAAEHPDEAADLLIEANPDSLGGAEELVHRSARMLADDGYLLADGRAVGEIDPRLWDEFGEFLLDGGFLVDEAGERVTDAPDWSRYHRDLLS